LKGKLRCLAAATKTIKMKNHRVKRLFFIALFVILALLCLSFFVVLKDIICLGGGKAFISRQEEVPVWIKTKVSKELKAFEEIDTKSFAAIDELILENKIKYLAHFKIIDNKVGSIVGKASGRHEKLKNAIERVLEVNRIGNSDFLVYLWDDVHYGRKKSFLLKELEGQGIDISALPPIFAFAADKMAEDRSRFVLFPDPLSLDRSIFSKLGGWSCLSAKIADANRKAPWSGKKNIAFWRGGEPFSNRKYNERYLAVELSRKYPKLLDVKFTYVLKDKKGFWERKLKYLYQFLNIGSWVSFDRYLEHKMILDLDGNTVSYPGMYWKLYGNSVVLKQVTDNEIWASDLFVPWLHFVPVKEDLGDLTQKIEWVKDHDGHAEQIAKTSNDFISKNLMPKHFETYIYQLLTEYSRLIK